MIKIAMIGAGSLSFTLRLVKDVLAVKELQDTEFRLMDINEDYLNMAADISRSLIQQHGLAATVHATTVRREAIRDADYVFCTVRVGGLEAMAHDIHIPLKFGIGQCVGDTLGPGGIFYALRSIPVLLDIAEDIREVAPRALLMNYSNPMAMNTWALRRAGGIDVVGLCHGVQGTHKLISQVLDLPETEVDFTAAGINHQTWFIQLDHKGKNMLPFLLDAFGNHPEIAEREPVRIDVLRRFGYFSTESNGHLSEYLPWYRKRGEQMARWIADWRWSGGETAGYFKDLHLRRDDHMDKYRRWLAGESEFANITKTSLTSRSVEHGSYIIEALETGRIYRGHFNVSNQHLVSNLPPESIVEIPCFVDRRGIHPTFVGKLPPACAATCNASISVQGMAVEAALTGNKELVKLAVMHDPLTAAICTTDEVWRMCDELFEAHADWLPQFNGTGARWQDLPQPVQSRFALASSAV